MMNGKLALVGLLTLGAGAAAFVGGAVHQTSNKSIQVSPQTPGRLCVEVRSGANRPTLCPKPDGGQ